MNSVTYTGNTGSNSVNYQVICKYNPNGYLNRLEDANENLLREINSINAFGQETSVGFGNGLTAQTSYTPSGLLTNLKTSNLSTSYIVQNMGYDFNAINGTLKSRTDIKNGGLTESFNYGALYRLEGYGLAANHQSVGYKPNGNIDTKTDAGDYSYDINGKPYTLSGIITPESSGQKTQLNINYTVMSRPSSISNGTYSAYIDYNDAYERVFEEFKQGANVLSTKHLLADGQFEVETKAGVETQRLYLDGSPYSASVVIEKVGSATAQPFYLHRDYLGSITQVSDKFGNLATEYSYDAWGRMRNATNWQVYATGTEPELRFGRGYTGHEHLNKLGLINMNARMYDPVLGRFLAPDPIVASPDESNGYNRYMYASNNPLMYVDIDGEQSLENPGGWSNPGDGRNNGGGNGVGYLSTSLPGSNNSGGFNMGSGFNYNGGYGGFSGNFGGGYSYGVSGNPIAFMFFLVDLFYTSKSERERFNVHVKSSPSAYTFKSTVRLKNVSGSGTSTVYAGGGRRQGGSSSSGWLKEAQYSIPVWGACAQAGDALSSGDYLNWACFFGLGFFEAFTFGEGTSVRLGMNTAAKAGGTAFRYMSKAELKAIQETGLLRGGRAGENFFTKDLYKSAAKASQRLGLRNIPTLRVEFEILNNPTLIRNGTKVLPLDGLSGGGAEFLSLDPVRVRLINWQLLK